MLFTIIDVIGVAKSASDVNTVTIKSTNKEIVKRDVQLVDQNRMQVNLTLWGSDVSRVAFSFLGVGWLCLTAHWQRGHLEMAPPFTVPCEGREAR